MSNADAVGQLRRPELPEKDAAISLCAMGAVSDGVAMSPNKRPDTTERLHIVEDDQPRAPECGFTGQFSLERKLALKKSLPKKKEQKRDPKVPFEEMKRLMRVYGEQVLLCLEVVLFAQHARSNLLTNAQLSTQDPPSAFGTARRRSRENARRCFL